MRPDTVVILDFGSQYTQLIARRVREAGVYSEIHPCTITPEALRALDPKAVILSGGPSSVTDADAPPFFPEVFNWGLPMLCICYGMQLLAHTQPGGAISASTDREYGRAELSILADIPLFAGLPDKSGHIVWMSHGDKVVSPPDGFVVAARTKNVDIAALADVKRRIYALQFHPEVAHTEDGERLLHNFLFTIAGLTPGWTMCAGADYVLVPLALYWRDRDGSAAGATKPASVDLSLYLIDVRTGGVVKHFHFEETQKALADNLLEAGKFVARHGRWLTAQELAYEGLAKGVRELGL